MVLCDNIHSLGTLFTGEDKVIKTADWVTHEQEVSLCHACPRLVEWREKVALEKRRAYRDWEYWGKPVPGFGDHEARVLVLGLAPGAHGSNRTGRMFTGDASGDFLYPALNRAGFASKPYSTNRDDDLRLKDIFITAVCRCAPPDNKPTPVEMRTCLKFWTKEWDLLPQPEGIVALGKIAFDAAMAFFSQRGYGLPAEAFGHDKLISGGAGKPWILATYHPSRQNTQTGRLTTEMFDSVWRKLRSLLDG